MALKPDLSTRRSVMRTRWGVRSVIAAGSVAILAMSTALTATAAPDSAGPARSVASVSGSSSHVSTAAPKAGQGPIWGDAKADKTARSAKGKNSTVADPGSLYTIEDAIGVRAVWKQKDAAKQQITGRGVGVALLDSGVAAVPGLDGVGKVVIGPDLSMEASSEQAGQDTFGHGTHMAGIIAAHDPADLSGPGLGRLSSDVQLGIAPDATIESLKLASTDGSVDVSQVIAALDWVSQHQLLPDGTRVRVVNLSFGTDSAQAYQSDPLAAAAENAWRHGLVVVVSGGNEGPDAGRLTNPAMDPYVLSVGASDGGGSVAGWGRPGVASFSSSGTAERHVDVLAPGRSIVSLRAPGSYLDVNNPQGLVDGDTDGRLFRGSGTSQAAAVVSGSVALLLQAYPDLAPDQVKAALMSSATRVSASPLLAGAGQIDVFAALKAAKKLSRNKPGNTSSDSAQSWPVADGQGSIDAARGGDYLVDAAGNELRGEIDIQGQAWDPAAWWAASSTLTSWQDGSWNGAVWTGGDWATDVDGVGFASARWSSARWSSARWSSARWSSARWSSARWSGIGWS